MRCYLGPEHKAYSEACQREVEEMATHPLTHQGFLAQIKRMHDKSELGREKDRYLNTEMKTKALKKILVGRPIKQVTDIMRLNGWSLVDSNEQHVVFSDGFNSLDVYLVDRIAKRIV